MKQPSSAEVAVVAASESEDSIPEPAPAEEVLFDGYTALLPSVGKLLLAIFTLGLALIYFAIQRRTRHYRITTQRIVIETGLFSKTMEQVDIYRIRDYAVERPLSQRLMGTGNLVLTAMDKSNPMLRLEGLPTDVRELYEQLRVATERAKERRGVRMIDYE